MVIQEQAAEMPASNGKQPQPDRKHRLKHRFEVSKKLGQGTYGKVQLAINKETGQEVAIKTIKKSKIESEQDLVRIRREIQIMSSIQHPNIIHIYEVFENKEKIVLVMQYASGGELYDYLSEKKALHDGDARRIFRQIAAAVYYCHKNKICHRDLKLENVLLDERGNAKIADFGLSNVYDERHLLGTFCGSPLYASPEIVKGTPYYGPEVDCWSMGVLLYTLVYGAMPFDGSNFKRLVKQISEGDYYEPKKKSDASGLIRRLLTVSPAKRATIIDICTDWWVNLGFEHSLLQVSEDTANLTPVRIDLLLALAPASPTPQDTDPVASKFSRPGIPDGSQKGVDSQEENGEISSNSFAFISGGMASEMKHIRAENPDDIFLENEASDEEFLSADAAAELESLRAKRRAEKSFDGSMIRVSSMAHKTKKPRKSNSVQKETNSTSTMDMQTDQSSELKKDIISEKVSHPEVVPATAAPVEDIVSGEISSTGVNIPPVADSEKLSNEIAQNVQITDSGISETNSIKEACAESINTQEPDPAQIIATPESTTSKEETKVKSSKTDVGSPTKEKKIIKRKIVSSAAKKAAAEKEKAAQEQSGQAAVKEINSQETEPIPEKGKTANANSPVKSQDKSPVKPREKSPVKPREKSPVKPREKSPVKSREKSPVKPKESPKRVTTEGKESTRRPSVEGKEPVRKQSTDSKEPVRKQSIDSRATSRKLSVEPKETTRRPSLEPKEGSPRKSSMEPKDSPRKPSVDLSKPPKKAESPKPNEKPKSPEKVAAPGSRKPGKLVMPRFLESPVGTPSPKTSEPKKLIIPIRSVSDAKKAFESKTKVSPPPAKTESIKSPEVAPNDTTAVSLDAPPTEDKTKTETECELKDKAKTPGEDVDVLAVNKEMVPVVSAEPHLENKEEEVSTPGDASLKNNDTVKEKSVTETFTNISPTVAEEEKKAAAKSILKKTIARAKLTERKLSQQSSQDSEPNTPPVSDSQSSIKAQNLSYIKTPKPYVKESPESTIKSQAEITLNNKVQKSISSKSDLTKEADEETIWGMPLSPTADQKLKRSVLSSSIESDMHNWRHEVEESLKRLSPEGAAEELPNLSTQQSIESNEAGPAPISRSYKKFTFNKDGTCTTETGEVYTKPDSNGTWTKIEKSTKVTSQPGASKLLGEPVRTPIRETSPLHHSDSQSSSGSNDIFDDIFDTWTGDSMFGNLMKMNNVFGRISNDPFKRRERRRDSMRRPKADKRLQQDWAKSEKRPGHLTDRDSSDNEEDFDAHFDGSDTFNPGSHNMLHFMRSMNKDFKNHLKAFKERHLPSYSRSMSRDRADPSMRDTRSRESLPRNGHSAMPRSVSRDRAQSPPPEAVLRLVIESPKRQTSVRSEPRVYHREDSWANRSKLSTDSFEDDLFEKDFGRNNWDTGYMSDFASKFEPFFDRTSLYGTIRPKAHQRYNKSMSRDAPGSPSTPQSTMSGPEFVGKKPGEPTDNRRQRVETWLQMNADGSDDKDFDPVLKARSNLHNVPENRAFSPVNTRTYTKYNRASTDRFPELHTHPHLMKEQGSTSPEYVRDHFKEVPTEKYTTPLDRPGRQSSYSEIPDVRYSAARPESPLTDRPPRQSSQSRVNSAGNIYTRSMGGAPFRVVTSPESVIEVESPTVGGNQPFVRMHVSFNRNNSGGSAAPEKEFPPTSPGTSEALKTRGYRNVMSQRFQNEQPRDARTEETTPNRPTEATEPRQQQGATQRATVTWQLGPGAETVIRVQDSPVLTCTIGLHPRPPATP